MPDDNKDVAPNINIGTGGLIQPIYTERRMRSFNVTEGDLSHLSLANWLVTGCTAFSSFCIAQALAIWTNAAFAEKYTEAAKVMTYFAIPTLIILALFGAVGAYLAHRWRTDHWKIIQKESIDRGETGSQPQ